MTPARWDALEQVVALALVSVGAGLIFFPAALIVFGLGLYVPNVLRRG